MSATDQPHIVLASGTHAAGKSPTTASQAVRVFCWTMALGTLVFVANNFLIFTADWPGFTTLLDHLGVFGPTSLRQPLAGSDIWLGYLQGLSYLLCLLGSWFYVARSHAHPLRRDAQSLRAIANYIVRAAFWSVVLIGLVDMTISFLRVEGFLDSIVGAELSTELGRSRFRGPYVHMPLIAIALVFAAVSRSLGFTWLALLVVVAELSIVLSRFIFSYEQAFQGDLVRFWYAALFLFASAHTLFEDGHVRVDVLYTTFSDRRKGLVNAIGSLLLGMSLCGVILAIGMEGKSSIINSPLLSFEVSQSGFGMYVKYLMAGFLAIFAVSMMIQFASTMLEGVADFRNEPGKREPAPEIAH